MHFFVQYEVKMLAPLLAQFITLTCMVGIIEASVIVGDEEARALEVISKAGGYVGKDDHGPLAGKHRFLQIGPETKLEIVFQQLPRLKHIDAVRFRPDMNVTDKQVEELAAVGGLKELYLSGAKDISDQGLTTIAKHVHLEVLQVGGERITDDGLAELKSLQNLRHLVLSSPKLTGKGFRDGAGFKKLEILEARFPCSDDGLKSIGNLGCLNTLRLRGAPVNDAALKELSKLKRLEVLDLSDTNITDAGVKHLSSLTSLQSLNLSRTRITDQGLKSVETLVALTSIRLEKTQIGDVGLAYLCSFPKLRNLELSGTLVTDTGIVQLVPIKSLQNLTLKGSKVTNGGRIQFMRLRADVGLD
jgi:internalin A